jgi:hypothetical protein
VRQSASEPARRRAAADPGTDRGEGGDGDEAVSPWRGTKPELVIAAVLVAAAGLAGYVMAGWAGLSAVVLVAAAIALAVLRALLPRLPPDQARTARKKPPARALSGYAQRRFVVETAIRSLAAYNGELRPGLEHLLAARLAERHGVHLYRDPAAARALLCRDSRDADLWAWIDPATRPKESPRSQAEQPGIPRRTLARLIDRLEIL